MSRTSSGVDRIRIEVTTELMHDDLPAPVAPAMSTCGISARFTITGRPAMSRPRATSKGWTARRASSELRMSASAWCIVGTPNSTVAPPPSSRHTASGENEPA